MSAMSGSNGGPKALFFIDKCLLVLLFLFALFAFAVSAVIGSHRSYSFLGGAAACGVAAGGVGLRLG